MKKVSTVTSLFLTVLFWLLAVVSGVAGTTITVGSNFYHIDHKNKIIIVNQDLNVINADKEVKHQLILDNHYTFLEPTQQVDSKLSYQVTSDGVLYTLYFTHLPIVNIRTRHEIVDSPKVYARFSLAEPDGTFMENNVGIEIRGGFSQSYPKKSFELSFWQDTLGRENQDVKLLNMRNDNKWNLQAMYNEPLRARNKVSHELWQEIHQIYYRAQEPDAKNGIAMTYVEVLINGEYRGLYALTERIDRKQLKLKKYNNGITGELYKGSDWGGAVTFTGLPAFDNNSSDWGGFEYKHPEEETDWTNLYNFVRFVMESPAQEFYRDYQSRFRIDNAVDYYIFLNLLSAGDNTGKNLYIARYKAGEPYYYVPWDLDGVFGTDWLGQNTYYPEGLLSNGFYDRLLQDCSANGFRSRLVARWAALRQSIITEEHILGKFEANKNYLLDNNIYRREQSMWNDFQYNEAQLTYTADWLRSRLRYLDVAFAQQCTTLSAAPRPAGPGALKLYPNPASDYLFVEFGTLPYELSIQDMRGRQVAAAALQGPLQKVAIGQLAKGMYIVTVKNEKFFKTEKLLVN